MVSDMVRVNAPTSPSVSAPGAPAVIVGGLVLIWPAFVNGYPLLFSDTGAFLVQALQPFMVFDKPWFYGPFLLALDGRTTLWVPAAAQGLLLSWVLWLVQGVFGAPVGWRHLVLCLVLAVGSAAPWFAALLMPDVFAPVVVLALFVLAFGRVRFPVLLGAVAVLGIAVHLSHLVIAAGCVLAALCLGNFRGAGRAAAPLCVALALLVASNVAGFARVAVSPFGSVFLLARLTADGPARAYLDDVCPAAGYSLCGWVGRLPADSVGRLPADSDVFLWDEHGPVWTAPGGPIGLAPEASRIVWGTILTRPLQVARAMAANTLTQLGRAAVGDALVADYIDASVGKQLRRYFPPAEQSRLAASAQLNGGLMPWATPLLGVHAALLLAGVVGTVLALALALWRGHRALAGLAAMVLAGVLANAFATGALSGPHDRYQARIAWILLLPPAMLAFGRRNAGTAAR